MARPHERLTLDEFIAWELQQEGKHEFVDGRVYLYGFAGGTAAHGTIAAELLGASLAAVRGKSCRAFGSDRLIATSEQGGRYADVVVTCDARDTTDPKKTSIRYPKLIVEVLSESTANDDLGPKMREYQAVDTLEEYVTIDSRKRWTQVSRREGDRWVLGLPLARGALELRSVGVTIELDELYNVAGVPA